MLKTNAMRRYNRRILRLSIAYALLLFPAVWLHSRHLVAGPLGWVVAILPALPIAAFFWSMGLYLVEEDDEYLRMLQVRQLLIGTGILLTAVVVWGFLEGFGLAPHLVAWWWSILWVLGCGIGALCNFLIERRAA